MNEKSDIEKIILRELNREATEEEQKTLEDWIKMRPANKEEFERTKRLWEDSTDAPLIPVDTEAAWNSVRKKTLDKKNKMFTFSSRAKVIAIAASILLIVGGIYYFNQSRQASWETTLAHGHNEELQLSDGTTITLRKGSKLSLPKDYGPEMRKVKLEGMAYFEVRHDTQNSFEVITSRSIIKDIGTAFLVNSIDSLEQVTVMEGEVSFATKKEREKPVLLTAGESAVLKNEIPQRQPIDTANLLSWKSKTLIFHATSLSNVANDLAFYFSIPVKLADGLDTIKITAEFRDEPLNQVIKELELFTGFEFTIIKDTLFISK